MSTESFLLKEFPDRSSLARELGRSVVESLGRALDARGRASLVVSGGSTPAPLFRALSAADLDWPHVTLTLADERWAVDRPEDRNETLVRRELCVDRAAAARFLPLFSPEPTPEAALDGCEAAVQSLPRPFDVVVLGMGSDGHTASLFPDTDGLDAALDPRSPHLCTALRPKTAPYPRLTLTLAALVASRRLIVHVTGEEKRRVIEQALSVECTQKLPIRRVIDDSPHPVEIFWAA